MSSEKYALSDNYVFVDYTPRFSPFRIGNVDRRGRLRLAIDLDKHAIYYTGWDCPEDEILEYYEFFSNEANLVRFFEEAYTDNDPEENLHWRDTSPMSLTINWNGRIKTITIGCMRDDNYGMPFRDKPRWRIVSVKKCSK